MDAVQLMTVHAAKGLEFPQVFIAGVEEGLFPHFSALKDERGPGVSEERRLMYVAITRAKQRLVITYCKSRMQYGEYRRNEPSSFLDEIPEQLVDNKDLTAEAQGYRSSYGGSVRPSEDRAAASEATAARPLPPAAGVRLRRPAVARPPTVPRARPLLRTRTTGAGDSRAQAALTARVRIPS